jgi:hypothetical protein
MACVSITQSLQSPWSRGRRWRVGVARRARGPHHVKMVKGSSSLAFIVVQSFHATT